eukprot:scaffold133_cov257-Pinguiococcus_pyrenoidosus.AAC.14
MLRAFHSVRQSCRCAARPAAVSFARANLYDRPRHPKEPAPTFNELVDNAARVFFLTDFVRGLWLALEVALKPKVSSMHPREGFNCKGNAHGSASER